MAQTGGPQTNVQDRSLLSLPGSQSREKYAAANGTMAITLHAALTRAQAAESATDKTAGGGRIGTGRRERAIKAFHELSSLGDGVPGACA